jgi:hypothetical protein
MSGFVDYFGDSGYLSENKANIAFGRRVFEPSVLRRAETQLGLDLAISD